MADSLIVHAPTENGVFVEGDAVDVRVKSDREAVGYYLYNLEAPIAHDRAAYFQELLQEHNANTESVEFDFEDPKQVLSAQALEEVQAAIAKEAGPTEGIFGNPLTTDFYDDPHKGGSKFSLGNKTFDYALDLSSRGWDNRICSVDTGKLVYMTLLCADTYGRGSKLWMFFDVMDLRTKFTTAGSAWCDLASSAATAGVGMGLAGPDDLLKLLGWVA
jgi:hypothetical protein